MTIFDSVPIKPTLSPTMQGVLSLLVLVGNSIVAADKCRQERLAGQGTRATPLGEVMAKSGLKIPGIHEALVQFMGDTEEAKMAASMIATAPDPASLLRQFAEQFACKMSANTGPLVTPPPAPTPASAPTAGPVMASPMSSPGLPKYRQDFTREAREAAKAAESARDSPLPKHRPDFTREAREEAKVASHPSEACDRQAPMVPTSPSSAEPPRSLLVAMIEQRLGALRRRRKAHEAELDLRLKQAEAELAMLRRELHDLRGARQEPAFTVVQAPEPSAGVAAHAMGDGTSEMAVTVREEAVAVEPPEVVTPEAELVVAAGSGVDPPLPLAASEGEVVRAVELIGAFAEEAEERSQQNLVRVVGLEQKVREMRALVQIERQARGASAHG